MALLVMAAAAAIPLHQRSATADDSQPAATSLPTSCYSTPKNPIKVKFGANGNFGNIAVAPLAGWVSSFVVNLIKDEKEKAGKVKKAVSNIAYCFPQYNVVLSRPHDGNTQNLHGVAVISTITIADEDYRVYVFKSGTVHQAGDLGYKNWGYQGSYNASSDGSTVTFSAPAHPTRRPGYKPGDNTCEVAGRDLPNRNFYVDTWAVNPDTDGETVKGLLNDFRMCFPDYNVVVMTEEQKSHWISEPSSYVYHGRYRLNSLLPGEDIANPSERGRAIFDIYVFDKGTFSNDGDGGYANWDYYGNVIEDGKKLTFPGLPPAADLNADPDFGDKDVHFDDNTPAYTKTDDGPYPGCKFTGSKPGGEADKMKSIVGEYGKCFPGTNVFATKSLNKITFSEVSGLRYVAHIDDIDVYTIDQGRVATSGDGGWENWGFSGSYKQEDDNKTVWFSPNGDSGSGGSDNGGDAGNWTPSADPSVAKVGNTYYSVESHNQKLWSRQASTMAGLLTAKPTLLWGNPDGLDQVWAPELEHLDGRFYVYFSAGAGVNHRMYSLNSSSPDRGYGSLGMLDLPDGKWAIDGSVFSYKGDRWFVWSGWEGDTDGEQNIYVAKMTSPTTTEGVRHRISQPHEPWERTDSPDVNEGPEPITDPAGDLHIVYSANHSWQDVYCLADLRLRPGGDPTYVWDWYKSNGCVMGSHQNKMMKGFTADKDVTGPGHHTFSQNNGSFEDTKGSTNWSEFMYHGVDKGTDYSSANRRWHVGSYGFAKDVTYSRKSVPGANQQTGYSPVFSEHPQQGQVPAVESSGTGPSDDTSGPAGSAANTADPSVIRVGGTYIGVKVQGSNIVTMTSPTVKGLLDAPTRVVLSGAADPWAPKLVKLHGAGNGFGYAIYYSSDNGSGRREYVMESDSPDQGFKAPTKLNLPGDRWATDGTAFEFDGILWFVWSGRAGTTNDEQNLYLSRMQNPHQMIDGAKRNIISQPREPWERKVGNPFINEAPAPIVDPNGQLHIAYSTNGSWSDAYCVGEIRLKKNGNPIHVWDWYKSNGCLFSSRDGTLMKGWDRTKWIDGPGSISFVLLDGDPNTGPEAGKRFPLMYHGVPRGTAYAWDQRRWYAGDFQWWPNSTYTRSSVPGDTSNTGWGLKFFERHL